MLPVGPAFRKDFAMVQVEVSTDLVDEVCIQGPDASENFKRWSDKLPGSSQSKLSTKYSSQHARGCVRGICMTHRSFDRPSPLRHNDMLS